MADETKEAAPKAAEVKPKAGAEAPAKRTDPGVRLAQVRELTSTVRAFSGQCIGIHDEVRNLLADGKQADAKERGKAIADRMDKLEEYAEQLDGLMANLAPDEDTVGIYEVESRAALENAGKALDAAGVLVRDGLPKWKPPEYVEPAPRPPDRPNENDTFIVYLDSHEGDEIKLSPETSVWGNRKARLSIDELRLVSKRVKHLVRIPPILLGGQRVILATSNEIDIPPEDTLRRVAEAREPKRGG
jgi:hypothetical protein